MSVHGISVCSVPENAPCGNGEMTVPSAGDLRSGQPRKFCSRHREQRPCYPPWTRTSARRRRCLVHLHRDLSRCPQAQMFRRVRRPRDPPVSVASLGGAARGVRVCALLQDRTPNPDGTTRRPSSAPAERRTYVGVPRGAVPAHHRPYAMLFRHMKVRAFRGGSVPLGERASRAASSRSAVRLPRTLRTPFQVCSFRKRELFSHP